MLLPIFITTLTLSFIILYLAITRENKLSSIILLATAMLLFAILAINSFNIQTQNCHAQNTQKTYTYNNESLLTNTTTTYTTKCELTRQSDTTTAVLTAGLSIISLTLIFVRYFI